MSRCPLGLIDGVLPWCSESAQKDLREARAAVAELVDAVRALDAAYIKHDEVRDSYTLSAAFRYDVGRQLVAAIARKDAALAKFTTTDKDPTR